MAHLFARAVLADHYAIMPNDDKRFDAEPLKSQYYELRKTYSQIFLQLITAKPNSNGENIPKACANFEHAEFSLYLFFDGEILNLKQNTFEQEIKNTHKGFRKIQEIAIGLTLVVTGFVGGLVCPRPWEETKTKNTPALKTTRDTATGRNILDRDSTPTNSAK